MGSSKLLQGLDDIDWAQYEHAYGPAVDVPDLIRALLSDDPEEVDETFYILHSTIWHQGTVYGASVYAVPFLLELLESDEMQDKASLLNLLDCLADGHSYQDVHVRRPEKRETPEVQAEIKQELGWVVAAHQAVRKGIPVYLKLLRAADQDTQIFAAMVLSKFPEDALLLAENLHTAIESEPKPAVKRELVASLGCLIQARDDFPEDQRRNAIRLLEAVFHDAPDKELALAAATALTEVTQITAPDEVIDMLIQGLADFDQHESGMIYSKHNILPALQKLGSERSAAALFRALAVTQNEKVVHDIAASLLVLVFGHDPLKDHSRAFGKKDGVSMIKYWPPHWEPQAGPPRETITREQHQALEALANCDVFWQIETDLLSMFGLPNDRHALKSYLQNQGLKG